jgi:hypothetical protein
MASNCYSAITNLDLPDDVDEHYGIFVVIHFEMENFGFLLFDELGDACVRHIDGGEGDVERGWFRLIT